MLPLRLLQSVCLIGWLGQDLACQASAPDQDTKLITTGGRKEVGSEEERRGGGGGEGGREERMEEEQREEGVGEWRGKGGRGEL